MHRPTFYIVYKNQSTIIQNKRINPMHLRYIHQIQEDTGAIGTEGETANEGGSIPDQILKLNTYVLIGIIVGIILMIILIICCIYRRYMTRKLYAETPQNFSYKPELGWIQRRRFQKSQIESLTSPVGQTITVKEDYEGKYHEIKFMNKQSCLYYHHQLVANCYFEIEFVQLNANVQIGFVHKDDIQTNLCRKEGGENEQTKSKKKRFFSKKQIQQKKKDEESLAEQGKHPKYIINFDQYGVSVKTDGSVIAYGVNINNYRWSIEYGDVIGIGITKHDGSRRIWVTRNGVLMNPPSQQQMLQQLKMEGEEIEAVSKKSKVQEDPQQKQKKQKLAAKNKIQLKTTKKFSYYAVIACLSNSEQGNQMEDNKETIINLNVGAHKFRLFDGNKMKGLLDK